MKTEAVFWTPYQGKYQRDSVLGQNEDLNKRAAKYPREYKHKSNLFKNANRASAYALIYLTAGSFCQWVNECLFETQTLNQGIHNVSVLKQLGNGYLN